MNRILEPFAGSAGYSVYYHERDIRLFDVDPVIVGLWDYLIHVKKSELLRLPTSVTNVDSLRCCQEGKWLIGFWLNQGAARPHLKPSTWAKDPANAKWFWGVNRRAILAEQLKYIKHWKIKEKSWEDVRNLIGTWFIDPPYQNPCGRRYTFNEIDFRALGAWCKHLRGEAIVCEQRGADWLPFKRLMTFRGQKKKSTEVIWHR